MDSSLTLLLTEERNCASQAIDLLPTFEMLKIINEEDKKVPMAIAGILPNIAVAVDRISQTFLQGGRLIYLGAGTSGRLGILDASECPPTFGSDPSQVVGLIAGGSRAITQAVENVEDEGHNGKQDLIKISFSSKDILVGIAASGRTPYVLAGMEYARAQGAYCIALTCNPDSAINQLADCALTPLVGPEVITGSSRMKAGSAQKMILNMLSTSSMIKAGKVFGNLMVDVQASNKKLILRQIQNIIQATGCRLDQAEQALTAANSECKTAILMLLADVNVDVARELLLTHRGFLRDAVKAALS